MNIPAPHAPKIIRRTPHFLVASGLLFGCAPKSPGTVGSLGGLLAWYLLATAGMCLEPHCDVTLIALVTAIGVWAIGRCLSESAANGAPVEDPQFVVIDEWAGLLIPLALTTPDEPALLLAAFVLFRLFDILKPWPVSAAERLPGAWGVMADDLVAGGLAAAVLYGGLRFFA
jgi:phosphatidylglycerophosphatase A